MAKTIMLNNGRLKTVDDRSARILVSLKKAIYVEEYEKKVIQPENYVKKAVIPDPKPVVPTTENKPVEQEPIDFIALYGSKVEENKPNEADETEDSELTEARKEYQRVIGKKAYHGWTLEEIRAKIKGE